MTRQYNTIFYNTVECDTKNTKKIQIHLLCNSNTIEVIKHSISYIISRCANKAIKFTMQPHALIRSTKIVKACFHNIVIQSTYL